MQKRTRMPSTSVRQRKYGVANQLAYEASERAERERLASTVGSKAKRAAFGAARTKNKRREKGANSGTMGGSRSLRDVWMASAHQ